MKDDPANDHREPDRQTATPAQRGLLVAFAVIAVLAVADLVADIEEGTTLSHVLVEAGLLILALTGGWIVLRQLYRAAYTAQRRAARYRDRLSRSRDDARRWKREANDLMRGLGAKIGEQFERWGLSPSEKDVALLLLKGLSHKEIAVIRGVTETTARQQAGAVYRKAEVSGRYDLAAFFLEDLALPAAQEEDNGNGTGAADHQR